MAGNLSGGVPRSGIGRQGDADPTARGADRIDTELDDRQAIEGRDDDDLSAATEAEAWRRAARSTPSSADVRSDDRGVPDGEPR
ncbi:hypothetical protein DWG18_11640 [Lysobacter sp. TY2-98]|uniref:hypothetical protein n=1 Tax=Lysobacter sp. TY2-98 TaxID=2290922 RepID=UPI000E20B638|nr:hypothetical protein [Lysobacter sp. TY2-98]AXK72868.1 hypothetical protein DWG18_11640 [Lysobacter sp. TY2-98]